MKNVRFACCIRINKFKAVKSAVRPASIVAEGIPTPITRSYPKSFYDLKIPDFAAKDNFCLFSKLILVERSLHDK